MIHDVILGVASALHPVTFLFVVIGVAAGIVVGAMPGLSAATGVALTLPLTYGMGAANSVILLAAMYVGAEYGGSISAILINTPGSPASIATVFDGYPLSVKGLPLKALSVSLVAGAFGSFVSTIALFTIAIPLANFALAFGPAEYFAVGVLGLALTVGLIGRSWTKGVLSALFGLLLGVIGIDPITGFPRFVFGFPELLDGVENRAGAHRPSRTVRGLRSDRAHPKIHHHRRARVERIPRVSGMAFCYPGNDIGHAAWARRWNHPWGRWFGGIPAGLQHTETHLQKSRRHGYRRS